MESLDEMFTISTSDDNDIYVDRDVWCKKEIIMLNAPLLVAIAGAGNFYSVDFSSEYIEKGQIKARSETFCRLV
ncbi:MAG: hypothetical protein J6L77_06350 [Coprococcus sp.]|nr:hypothetical protein [Coprococcus sp.]